MNLEEVKRLFTLLGALRDEVISPVEFEALNALLENNETAREYYLDYVYLCTDLCNLQAAVKQDDLREADLLERQISGSPTLTLGMLRELGDYERNAETIPLPKKSASSKSVTPVIERMPVTLPRRKVSKLSIVTFVASLAALLFLVAYVHIVLPDPSYEVATLSDSMDAQWASSVVLQNGSRLSAPSSEPFRLQQGVVEIRSDKDVLITIEAPAEFNFSGSDEIVMNYGRLFALVPPTGSGFTVQTQNAKVIDLGTEFGVFMAQDGQTEVHVYKGQSAMITELPNQTKRILDVRAGQAYEFEPSSKDVRIIALARTTFARAIDSKAKLIWRGQQEIHLADVVGGGSGFGTGRTATGIDPEDGHYGVPRQTTRRTANTYKSVPSNVFIDGIFVPNGANEQIVTSTGLAFKECPTTTGYFYTDIVNTPLEVGTGQNPQEYPLLMGDINYSTMPNSFIFLHANLGITFDLDAFRSRLPETDISAFSSDIGISNSAPISAAADFWVLVDGKVRYHKHVSERGPADSLQIEIKKDDRFLSLITTDGGIIDPETDRNAIGYDWCMFAYPKLFLK